MWTLLEFLVDIHGINRGTITQNFESVKCHPLFGPQFSKVKIRFVFEIREVSDTLTPNGGVCGDTPV